MRKISNRIVNKPNKRMRQAQTPEERENQLIMEAYDLVEQRLLDGTASATETVHFLKMGSAKERLEKQILQQQKEYMAAKTEAIQSAKRVEELYSNAIDAIREYQGYVPINDGKEDEQ